MSQRLNLCLDLSHHSQCRQRGYFRSNKLLASALSPSYVCQHVKSEVDEPDMTARTWQKWNRHVMLRCLTNSAVWRILWQAAICFWLCCNYCTCWAIVFWSFGVELRELPLSPALRPVSTAAALQSSDSLSSSVDERTGPLFLGNKSRNKTVVTPDCILDLFPSSKEIILSFPFTRLKKTLVNV